MSWENTELAKLSKERVFIIILTFLEERHFFIYLVFIFGSVWIIPVFISTSINLVASFPDPSMLTLYHRLCIDYPVCWILTALLTYILRES